MLELKNISKKYRKGPDVFIALDDVSLKIEKGDYILINGPSGAGKSTLLYSLGGLIHPDSGTVQYQGIDIYSRGGRFLDRYRKNFVGFMFQQFHLMPYLTVIENIKMACTQKSHLQEIERYLEKCSLSALRNKYPSELSVGEKQRTAFVRAIIPGTGLLLMDEPTGNLDPRNSGILMSLVDDFHRKGGTVVIVSHDHSASRYSTRNIILEKGRITA
jgi:ABC-type lipoprotein export system ATPase subunit